MKVLVVGGVGYIGYQVSLGLRDEGHNVFILDPDSSRVPQAMHAKLKFINGEVLGIGINRTFLESFEAIVNLTGGLDDYNLYGVDSGFVSQACALRFLRDCNPSARIVHISTMYVYSRAEMNKERSKATPSCDYGICHLMAESSIQDDSNAVILRFGTVWGGARFVRWDTWGNHLVRLMDQKQPIDINYPNAVICLLSMRNAVRSVVWAVSGERVGIFNVADKIGLRLDIVKEVLKDYPYTRRPYSNGFSIGMDCTKIKKAGFSFQ